MATGMENSKASMIIITQSGLHRQPLCRNRREWTYEKRRKAAVSGRDPACHRRPCFFCMETERIYGEYQEGEDTYEELAFICGGAGGQTETRQKPDAEPDGYLKIDFEGLQAVNPDVIAWIDIPGLSISYPVVQGTDNAYYLHHLFTGEYNSSGSIFADWHNQPDFTDPNTIVYGHNMKNGSMFGTLSHYQDQALWEASPYFYLYVPGKVLKYQIFSCYAGYVGARLTPMRFRKRQTFKTS